MSDIQYPLLLDVIRGIVDGKPEDYGLLQEAWQSIGDNYANGAQVSQEKLALYEEIGAILQPVDLEQPFKVNSQGEPLLVEEI